MPRRKGRGEGKWRSLKTGRYVSAHYGKRNPNRVIKEEPTTGGEHGQGQKEGREQD